MAYFFGSHLQNFFKQCFSSLDDPRSKRNQRHNFEALIVTTILAILSGQDGFTEMRDFTEMHLEELSKIVDLRGGVPSDDTYRRLWNALDPEQFQKCFSEFVALLKKVDSNIISIDGKTIRNSAKSEKNARPLHIVSAWCQDNQLVFAQEKVHAKSNEITAIPELLKKIDINNKTITIDAMGAQREICKQIIEGGGSYAISLKGNQDSLHKDVQILLKNSSNYTSTHTTIDKGHGRIEQREACVCTGIDELQKKHNWPGLRAIAIVKSTVEKKDRKTREWEKTEESRFYLLSDECDAEQTNKIARKHWGIENQLHWRLDVSFNEDKCCIQNDNSAENMNILRKWALAITLKIRDKSQPTAKSVMRRNSMSFKHLTKSVEKILKQMNLE